jgi:hypothetical protein
MSESVAVVRVYRAEIGSATDVSATPSMQGAGPKLPDGRQSVVLVGDNNFSPIQVTRFLLLAM